MIEVATKFWKTHDGIKLTDWNDTLRQRSIPFETFKIEPWRVQKLLEADGNKERILEAQLNIGKLYDHCTFMKPWRTETQMSTNPPEFFAKLITRSPKDYTNKPFIYGAQMIEAFARSYRTFEDLCLLKYIDKCEVIVRPWKIIPKHCEWRVFVMDGNISGISQYHYNEYFVEVLRDYREMHMEIRDFVKNIVIPNMTVKTFVADVLIRGGDIQQTTLLETNPYYTSDPCLFEEHFKLDGSFRYNRLEVHADHQ